MSTTTDGLKRELQSFFQDGLVVIVGSGLSAAEGIPGMGALESHLASNIPRKVVGGDLDCWGEINKHLTAKKGLEVALLATPPTGPLEDAIISLTLELIEPAERRVLEEVITGKRVLQLSYLLPHANPQPNRPLPVVTANYERLVEFAAEAIEWGVDSMFVGQSVGRINPELVRASLTKRIIGGRQPRIERRPHVQICKPHGSLDWYQGPDGPFQTSVPLALPRLIITPGRNKYRKGYDRPFDLHREAANRAIDEAARLLVLGYGFNDDHLETHLSDKLRRGTPCLALTRTLSPNARKLIAKSSGMIALSEDPANATTGFLYTRQSGEIQYDSPSLWQLKTFVQNILTP